MGINNLIATFNSTYKCTNVTSFWIFEHFASQWAAYYQRGWGFDHDLDIKQDPIFHTAAAAVVGASGLSQPLMT